MMRHILSILMENESGAMSRVVGLFSARGCNGLLLQKLKGDYRV